MAERPKFNNNGHRLHSMEHVAAINELTDATLHLIDLIHNPHLEKDRVGFAIAQVLSAAGQEGIIPLEQVSEMIESFYPSDKAK